MRKQLKLKLFNKSMKKPKIKNLVLSGGGIKGLAICGALEKLDEKMKILSTVKTIIGSSIGAFVGFFLSIGLSIKKIKAIYCSFNFNDFQEVDLKLFISKFGLDEGNKFLSLVKATIVTQGYDPKITFKDLEKISKYKLIIVGTNVNLSSAKYFSSEHTPDFEVYQALRISGGYPLAFTPVEIDGDLFSDGGIVSPLPSELIPKSEVNKTLGLAIHRSNKRYKTDNVFEYLFGVISCILDSLLDKNIESLKHVILLSYPIGPMEFGIDNDEKQKLYNYGTEMADNWLNNFEK